MNNAVFWDVGPCRYFVSRRFGGTYVGDTFLRNVGLHKIYTRHIPEDGILFNCILPVRYLWDVVHASEFFIIFIISGVGLKAR
jgi:hypothetical protein